jgi:GntR family transcriptional regulator/MocR family aminotransferase
MEINMIVLNLDPMSKIPLHRQVFTHIKEMIENNTLKVGSKLPASRVLANSHGISRTVVYRSYQELWSQGYLESRPGSYSIVRKKTPNINLKQRASKSLIDWNTAMTEISKDIYGLVSKFPESGSEPKFEHFIDMSNLQLDPQIFPIEEFKRSLNRVIMNNPGIFNYGVAKGYLPLRNYIASRLQTHGIWVTPEEVLITNGTQSSIDLILRTLTQPGSNIISESPTYYYALPLFHLYQSQVIPISMDEDGLNIKQLEQALKREHPSFIYTVPNFQNPTGITMSQEKRESMLALAEKHKIPIIEDAFEEEMKYFGKVPLSIKSMDKNQVVIYVSSFSKVLFPGIRIGWIAANKTFIDKVTAIKNVIDLKSNSVIQAALYEFCKQGYYDLHIRRMHHVYKKRMEILLYTLKKEITFKQVSWNEPIGGYLIWLKISGLNMTEDQMHTILLKHRVLTSPGSLYFSKKPESHFMRLSISELNEADIIEGIKRLKSVFSEIYSG